jgi:hypothetical protein
LKIVFLAVLILFFSCRNDLSFNMVQKEVVIPDTIKINIVRQSQTSIAISIHKKRKIPEDTYHLIRTDSLRSLVVGTYSIKNDSIVVLDTNFGLNLFPASSYVYKMVRKDAALNSLDSSNILFTKTLGVASRNFEWQLLDIGKTGYYYDAWAESEDKIYLLGSKSDFWNDPFLMHYTGFQWQEIKGVGGIAIWGFSDDDVWIVGYSRVYHFDGDKWESVNGDSNSNRWVVKDKVLDDNLPYYGVWGTSSSNIFFTSGNGNIVHWNGQSASLVETGLTERRSDIFGLSENFILTAVRRSGGNELLLYENGDWITYTLNYSPTGSVFPFSEREYFFANHGVVNRVRNGYVESILSRQGEEFTRIRGNLDYGELFVTSYSGRLFHFNGVDWYDFSEDIFKGAIKYPLRGLLVNKKFILSVGDSGTVIKGVRQ